MGAASSKAFDVADFDLQRVFLSNHMSLTGNFDSMKDLNLFRGRIPVSKDLPSTPSFVESLPFLSLQALRAMGLRVGIVTLAFFVASKIVPGVHSRSRRDYVLAALVWVLLRDSASAAVKLTSESSLGRSLSFASQQIARTIGFSVQQLSGLPLPVDTILSVGGKISSASINAILLVWFTTKLVSGYKIPTWVRTAVVAGILSIFRSQMLLAIPSIVQQIAQMNLQPPMPQQQQPQQGQQQAQQQPLLPR